MSLTGPGRKAVKDGKGAEGFRRLLFTYVLSGATRREMDKLRADMESDEVAEVPTSPPTPLPLAHPPLSLPTALSPAICPPPSLPPPFPPCRLTPSLPAIRHPPLCPSQVLDSQKVALAHRFALIVKRTDRPDMRKESTGPDGEVRRGVWGVCGGEGCVGEGWEVGGVGGGRGGRGEGGGVGRR